MLYKILIEVYEAMGRRDKLYLYCKSHLKRPIHKWAGSNIHRFRRYKAKPSIITRYCLDKVVLSKRQHIPINRVRYRGKKKVQRLY